MSIRAPRLAALAAATSFSTAAGAQRIAPLPKPCRVLGALPSATLPPRIPGSLAVSLFSSDSTDPAGELAAGLSDAIANRLGASVPRILVMGRRAQRRLVVVDSLTARGMADSLGAAYVLAARVTQGLRGRTVAFTLYNGATGRALMYRTLPHDSAHVMLVEQNVSAQVATQILRKLRSSEQKALERVPSVDGRAYDAFVRGQGARDVWAFGRAAQYFRDAARIDRSFGAAYAELALADAEILQRGLGTGATADVMFELRAAASHAIALDSTSSLAWRAQAQALLLDAKPTQLWRRAYDKAVALDPRDPAALEEYGLALVRTGDREAGRPLLERALVYEPGRAQPIAALATLAIYDHRDASACTLLNQAIVGDVLFAPAWAERAVVRAQHGDLRFAWADAETATQLGASHLGESAAAIVDLFARDTAHARDRLYSEWSQVKAAGAVGIVDGTAIARAMIAAGQSTRALDVLELARPRGPWFVAALRDPTFDTIRGDRRFLALIANQ